MGKKQPGIRDGTGSFLGSRQSEKSSIGRRKERGEKCPKEDKTKEVDFFK